MMYKVFVNNKLLQVHDARVSACPINRVWQGKQRVHEQTEIGYFVSFDADFPADIRVEVYDTEISLVEIRPLNFNIPFTREQNNIYFTIPRPMQITVEINGYHQALHIFANKPYVYKKQPNDIYFGPGVHYAGLICPAKGQRVVVDNGAVVYGVVYINNADYVCVEGRGIIDGSPYRRGNDILTDDISSEVNRALLEKGVSNIGYIGLFNIVSSKNVSVEGVILRDSQFWTFIIHPDCENILVDNIKIVGQWRYNSDGVDICASKKVTLKNSFIRSFDDSVVIRASYSRLPGGDCSDITVENNVLWCDWGKNLEIWSGDRDSIIKNVIFKNNYLIHSQMVAMSIDTWYGSDNILVENIVYDGIYVEHDMEHLHSQYQESDDEEYDYSTVNDRSDQKLIYINVGKIGKNIGNQMCDPDFDVSGFRIRYKNIHYRNITQTEEYNAPIKIYDTRCELSNVTIDGLFYKEYINDKN